MQIDGTMLERPAPPLEELLRAGFGARLGLATGDRLASLMPNRIDLVVHYLACFRAGLVATPLNYRYTFREIDHALEVSGAKALLAHVERAGDVAESRLAGELERGAIAYGDDAGEAEGEWGHDFATLLGHEQLPAEPPPDPGEAAAIFFTSGSTGPAKGVTHTRESLRWMIASAAAAFELDATDAFLPGSSMSHIGSFLWALSMLSVGGRVVVAHHRQPRAAAAAARAAAERDGDDPGGAAGPGPRPRPAARRPLLPADLPFGLGQGLGPSC